MSAAPTAAPTPLPRTFGRYALFDFIGKGGMAEIYLARQKTELGATRLCVVKQILPGLAGDPKFSDMLVHEAKLAARLSHANVVQVFDLGRADARLFIAMEYVEGFDLNDLLGRCSRARVPLPFELAVHVLREALRGLDYAHRRTDDEGKPLGIVHRDVSPSNLLVSFEGEVKVCDFGIAHANDMLAGETSAHELSEAVKGKAGYMSPEHASGQPIDARSDVFAAGVVLWELAAGRRLYKMGEGRETLLEQARRAEVPELPAQGLPDPEKLRAIVGKALARDRAERYVSAAAMLRDLEGYAASARLMTSPLALGDWLEKTFGADILAKRRTRERAAAALERGAPLFVQAIAPALPPPPSAPLLPVPTPLPSAPVDYRIDVEPNSTGMLPVYPASSPALPVAPVVATRPAGRRVGVVVLVAFLVLGVLLGAGLAIALALHARWGPR
ncbi:MAG TPA: serine/threonine-protein kinase [Polyangiaceae bacterium]|jgi:serine/threonine-protein kinase